MRLLVAAWALVLVVALPIDKQPHATVELEEQSHMGHPNKVKGRGATVYVATRWWNKKLTEHSDHSKGWFPGAVTDFTVEEERHHIIPWNLLSDWWNKMIADDHIVDCGDIFLSVMKAKVDTVTGFVNDKADGIRQNVKDSITKILAKEDATGREFEDFVGYFAYLPGNIFFGPGYEKHKKIEHGREEYDMVKARSEDPGEAFEITACGIDKVRWATASAAYTAINKYIGDGLLASCQEAATEYAKLSAHTSMKEMLALDWIFSKGFYSIRIPEDGCPPVV